MMATNRQNVSYGSVPNLKFIFSDSLKPSIGIKQTVPEISPGTVVINPFFSKNFTLLIQKPPKP